MKIIINFLRFNLKANKLENLSKGGAMLAVMSQSFVSFLLNKL